MNNTLDLVRFVTVLVKYAATQSKEQEIKRVISTHRPSKRHELKNMVAYTRLGGTSILVDNVHCGRLRHNIVIDIYSPKTNSSNVEEVFKLQTEIRKEFGKWGRYLRRAGTCFKDTEDKDTECKELDLDDLKRKVREADSPLDREDFEELIGLEKENPGPYELASSFLENGGSYSMADFVGAGLELSFDVDEVLQSQC